MEPLVVLAVPVELAGSDFFSEVDPDDEPSEELESLEDLAPDVLLVDLPSVRLSVR